MLMILYLFNEANRVFVTTSRLINSVGEDRASFSAIFYS